MGTCRSGHTSWTHTLLLPGSNERSHQCHWPPVTTTGMLPILKAPVDDNDTLTTVINRLWPETLLLNNHCTAAASNWSGHLSRGRNSHLLQLPQNHWPTHVQSRTGWPMGWGRCIFSQYHSDYAGWQSLLLRCHRTPTYIQISLAPQVANVQIMTGSMWPLMSSPKVLVRCWRSTTLLTIE